MSTKDRIIFVPLYNFFSAQPDDIEHLLRIPSYLLESLTTGITVRSPEDFPKLSADSTVLLASSLLKRYGGSTALDLTAYISEKAQPVFEQLGNPESIAVRNHAIEVDYHSRMEEELSYLKNQPLRNLSGIVSDLILGHGLQPDPSIAMLARIIECDDIESAKKLADEFNLREVTTDLFFGFNKKEETRPVSTIYIYDSSGMQIGASIIVTTREGLARSPTREMVGYLLLVSLFMAEAYSIEEVIPDVIFQLYVAQLNMHHLFESLTEKKSMVRRQFWYDKEVLARPQRKLVEVTMPLLSSQREPFRSMIHGIYSEKAYPRLSEISEGLIFIPDLLSSQVERAQSAHPILADLVQISSFKPVERIYSGLEHLREELPNFIKSFNEERSEIQTTTRIEIATKGVLVSATALAFSLIFNLVGAIPSSEIRASVGFIISLSCVTLVFGWVMSTLMKR
jgi:hypothetical protein